MAKQELSLEELSAATGMTARNVRAYQTKGLIPPPTRSGRRSVYGVDHLHRLQAIERARAKGASLSLIAAHLAAGRALDDDTLVGWAPPEDVTGGAAPPGSPAEQSAAPATHTQPAVGVGGGVGGGQTQDIAPLLAGLSIQRDAAAQSHFEELVDAGIFRPDGGRVLTGRELADALGRLQAGGMPVQVALGVAQRVLRAAAPVAAAMHAATQTVAATVTTPAAAPHGPLGEMACYVMRHVVTQYAPDDAAH